MTAALTFHQPFGIVARLIVGAAGAWTLIAPYELLIRPGVPVFSVGMIPFWFILLGALSIGATLFGAALFGISRTVRFDPPRRAMDVHGEGSIGMRVRRSHASADLGAMSIDEPYDSDGPTGYRLSIFVAGRKRPLEITVFPSRPEAESTADAVRKLIAS